VRLNSSLFPADVITFRSSGGVLTDVKFTFTTADARLKATAADGLFLPQLRPEESVDIFVHEKSELLWEFSPLPHAHLRSIRPGEPVVMTVNWAATPDSDRRETAIVVWTFEDRTVGLAPRIAWGRQAATAVEYVERGTSALTAEVMGLRKRVKRLGRRDIRNRRRYEEKEHKRAMEDAQTVYASAISVRGFRGFRETAELRLAQPTGTPGSGLTIVVGANNTGKSTVWESFDAVARKLASDVSFSEGRRNRGTPGGIRIELGRADGSKFIVESRNESTSETKCHWELAPPSSRPLEIVSVPSRRQFQASFGKNVTTQRDWMSSSPEFTRFRQQDQFTGRLFDLHNNDAKKTVFDELMTEVLGYSLNWSIELGDGQFGQSYFVKVSTGEGVNHSSEGLGDGIISLLYILNALYDSEEETLLVLDEPELSLHPQLVKRLGRVLSRFASTRQIVVFTHSPLLVSWDDIQSGAEIARVHKAGSDSRIAQVPRATIDEVSKARGGWRNPHTLGSDANEALFLDDGIVVVEGQEDAGLLPVVFEQAGVPQRGTVFGWGAGGGDGNPRRIAALLAGLGFSRVVVLLDADKPDEAKAIQEEFPTYLARMIPADDIRDKPANNFVGKAGLLDHRGRKLKDDFQEETRTLLEEVTAYLSTG